MMTRRMGMTLTVAALFLSAGPGWAGDSAAGDKRLRGKRVPQEAVAACKEHAAGDAVTFANRRGIKMEAICRDIDGRLVAVPEKGGAGRRGPLEHLAERLDLSAAQKSELQKLFAAEEERNAPQRQQLAESRKELKALTQSESFDEGRVRQLAAAQEPARTEQLVSHLRLRHGVWKLLTPAQRAKADRLEDEFGGPPPRDLPAPPPEP